MNNVDMRATTVTLTSMLTVKCLLAILLSPLAVAEINLGSLEPGRVVDLSGTWEYRPGFQDNYVSVPVPQMLSRIQWWLDDSEDFNAWEDARLKKLGFDTERAEDGWYRLIFQAPALKPGTRAFIEFDGVAMKSRTYLNQQLLGEHTGMFSRFAYDLTAHMKPGRNELSVFVSMEKLTGTTHPMSEAVTVNLTAAKVMTLSKGMFGPLSPNRPDRDYDLHGIWQPVRLVVRGEGKIDDAWFIPSLNGAEIRVEARGLNKTTNGVLRATWTDVKTGQRFATAGPVPIRLETQSGTASLSLRDVRPKLWTPAEANLYRLEVRLESERGELLDRWERNVGFRTFEIRGNQFYLNGHRYWLRGGNQLPYGKNPWDPQLAKRLIGLLHDNNLRVTRTHATPWNEAWLDAADEIGLGVSIEGIRPWALAGLIGVPSKSVHEHWLMENADVVRRARNHPSVLIWTVGNEMLLRDSKSIEKWKMLSEVVRQTRTLDPHRPVVASSEYTRDPDFYDNALKPASIDDGDIDDLHRYRGWYTESPFVTDSSFVTEMRRNRKTRPLIGQEMSSGYPDLDSGLPVSRYTRELITPQAWVGDEALAGKDPATFLEHNRAVTKRWAEQLRFERGDNTAGFLLFSAECWFRHSYDPQTVKPYPVIEALRQAFAPLGLALETGRRRFFAGEEIETSVFVTNDDEQFRDYDALTVTASVGGVTTTAQLAKLPYYATARVPLRLRFPKAGRRRMESLQIRLMLGGRELSKTIEPVAIFPEQPVPDLSAFVQPGVDLSGLAAGGELRKRIESGETIVVLKPGKRIVELFPKDVMAYRDVTGEYADWSPSRGSRLTRGLETVDLKWWGRKGDWRVFVASGAHRLVKEGTARELIRFIPAHSYIAAERVPEQYQTVLFEIPLGKGRLWVCDLDLLESAGVDPAARMFAANLLAAVKEAKR